MFKRKQNIENIQERISDLAKRHFFLRNRVTQLEQRTKQLECKHNFKFDSCRSIGIWGQTNIVCHKCTECGKTITKYWDNIAKKGQQALKLLNLVPKNWKIKGDKQ